MKIKKVNRHKDLIAKLWGINYPKPPSWANTQIDVYMFRDDSGDSILVIEPYQGYNHYFKENENHPDLIEKTYEDLIGSTTHSSKTHVDIRERILKAQIFRDNKEGFLNELDNDWGFLNIDNTSSKFWITSGNWPHFEKILEEYRKEKNINNPIRVIDLKRQKTDLVIKNSLFSPLYEDDIILLIKHCDMEAWKEIKSNILSNRSFILVHFDNPIPEDYEEETPHLSLNYISYKN